MRELTDRGNDDDLMLALWRNIGEHHYFEFIAIVDRHHAQAHQYLPHRHNFGSCRLRCPRPAPASARRHAVFARAVQRAGRAAVHAVLLQRVQSRPVHPRDRLSLRRKPAADHDLDNIGDLFAALRSCWSPPPADGAREGMQMSVRFSFKRSGEIIGNPRLTFATAGVPADTRATYLKAINASLAACAPLKFTGGLGGAIAGRPIMIRYVDNRDLGKQAEKP
jgi:hypothetical protein